MTDARTTPQEYEYEVVQDGIVVARGWGGDPALVLADASHYAAMYAKDGPVELRIKPDKRRRRAAVSAPGDPS